LSFHKEISSQPGGENIARCFACGTCTISCPVFEIREEYNPRRIIRMAALGMRDELLSSELIWSCVNCYTCFERCPQDVRFTSIIHVLRNMAVREAGAGRLRLKWPGYAMALSFLGSIRLHGRNWEPQFMGWMWLRLMDPRRVLSFIPLGIRMFLRRKIEMFPSRIRAMKEIRAIFRAAAIRAEKGNGR